VFLAGSSISSGYSSFAPVSKCSFRNGQCSRKKTGSCEWPGGFFPSRKTYDGWKFFVRLNGELYLTPLALALLLIETTDVIFAVDSVPAVFSVTQDAFIVFTSNVFAILGLRSMYFLLVGAIRYFRYLNIGMSAVLVFIGVKMLLDPHHQEPRWFQVELPTSVSLEVVAAILLISVALSVTAEHRGKAQTK
jgi:tellurite resistance protein TerC